MEVCTLVIECPWRVERADAISAGSEDDRELLRSERTSANGEIAQACFAEQPADDVVNDVDAKLGELSGLSVSSVECDAIGGFRIHFGGNYVLAVFPASEKEMEWMLRWKSGGYMALMNGKITDSLPGVAVF